MTPAAVLQVLVTANTAEANAALAKTQAQLRGTAATAQASTAKIAASSSAARASIIGFAKWGGLAIAGLGAASIHMATEFDKNMTMLITDAGAAQGEVRKLNDQVLELAKNTQFSPEELARALYHIESVGFRGAEAMRVLNKSQQLAAVGNADLERATYATVSALETGIKGTENMTDAVGMLNAIVGHGDMRLEDLTAALSSGVVPSAKAFGLTLQDVGAALDIFTARGTPAQAAATRLRMTFALMGAPTDAAQKALKEIGLGATDIAVEMRKPEGIVRAVELLHDHLAELPKVEQAQVLTRAFGGGRTSAGIITLVQNVKELEEVYGELGKSTDEFDEHVKRQSRTAAARFARVWSTIEATLVQVGQNLSGPVSKGLEQVTNIIFDPKLSIEQKLDQTTKLFAGWVSDLVPVALHIGGEVAKGIFTGILHAPPLAQAVLAAWLFVKLGGIGMIASVAKRMAVEFWTRFIAYEIAGSAISAWAASMGFAFLTAMKLALPVALAGLGLYNIMTSVLAGDVHDAGFKLGGALAGGIAGGLLGGPLGALAGAGIGSLLGGLVGDMFDGGQKLGNMQTELKRSASAMKDALEKQESASQALKDSSHNVDEAHHRQKRAARQVKEAEKNYQQTLDKYPAHSRQALEALAQLKEAHDKERRAARQARQAEKLHGIELQGAKKTYKATVAAERDRINALKDERSRLVDKLREDRRTHASNEQWKEDYDKLNANTKKLNATQKQLGSTLQDASREVGDKFAKQIKNTSLEVLHFGRNARLTADDITGPLKVGVSRTKPVILELKGASEKTGDAMADSAKHAAKATEGGMQRIRLATGHTLDLFGMADQAAQFGVTGGGGGGKQKKQMGGRIVPGRGIGDKVHALLEPGEVVWNKKAVAAMGGAAKANEINRKIPRFQGGGVVFPHRDYPMLSGDTDMNPALGEALSRMAKFTSTPIFVTSGGRTTGEQQGLQGGPNVAAAPGTSHHEFINGAYAADIAPGYARFGNIAKRFGMTFPLLGIGEPWHIELLNAMAGGATGASAAAFKKLVAPTMTGPNSAMKTIGQAAFDKVTKAGNNFLATKLPMTGGLLGNVATGPIVQMAKAMVKQIWGMSQWSPFNLLEQSEAGWNPRAQNTSSGAAGLAQALPPSKYPAGAWPYRGLESAKLQLQWMMGYIRDRYGNPAEAWAFHQAHNWYQRGGVAMVGDSLGVGMNRYAGFPGGWTKRLSEGKSSGWGLSQLKDIIGGNAAAMFEMGTNDANNGALGTLRKNIRAAKKLARQHNAGLALMTTAGVPNADKANQIIRGSGADAIANWAGISDKYLTSGPHPGASGYRAMQALVKNAANKAKRASSGGPHSQHGHGPHWLDPNEVADHLPPSPTGLRHLLDAIPQLRGGGDKHQAVQAFLQNVKQVGLPQKLNDQMGALRQQINTYAEYADRASQLTDYGIHKVHGATELEWLQSELGAMWKLRNRLLDAQDILQRQRKNMDHLLERARSQLRKIQREMRQAAKEKEGLQDQLDDAKHNRDQQVKHWKAALDKEMQKKPKDRDNDLIRELRTKIREGGSLDAIRKHIGQISKAQGRRADVVKALQTVIPVIGDKAKNLAKAEHGKTNALFDLQGHGKWAGSMTKMKDMPTTLGLLGGDIFAVQMLIKSAQGASAPQALSVSDLQAFGTALSLGAFKTVPYMGAFAKGGVAMVGEKGPELIHTPSGSRVHSADDTTNVLAQAIANALAELDIDVTVMIGDEPLNERVDKRITINKRNQARKDRAGRKYPA